MVVQLPDTVVAVASLALPEVVGMQVKEEVTAAAAALVAAILEAEVEQVDMQVTVVMVGQLLAAHYLQELLVRAELAEEVELTPMNAGQGQVGVLAFKAKADLAVAA
jgi:hypothetical protein